MRRRSRERESERESERERERASERESERERASEREKFLTTRKLTRRGCVVLAGKSRPESVLVCLICAMFARQRNLSELCLCVCVGDRERESESGRKREREKARERERKAHNLEAKRLEVDAAWR